MADNLGHKAGKLAADKSKAAHPTTLSTGAGPQRKKTPAFQITSVTVVNTRPSTDGGEDSADDLDESHTDDTSDVVDVSRVTDVENETPSFSEDTFSKEDVFFNAAAASLGSAPVIPTSAQYGLALLGGEGGAHPPASAQTQQQQQLASEPAAAPDSGTPGKQQQDAEMRDVHASGGRNERFKVVKIESTVPFKRGRWTCMDYLDHSTMQQQQQAVINVTESGSLKYCGADSGVVLTDSSEPHEPHHQQQPYCNQNLSAAQTLGAATVSPGQTLQQVPHVQQGVPPHPQSMSQVQMPPQSVVPNAQQHQSLPPHQFQQVMANAQQAQSYVGQQPNVVAAQQQAGYYVPPASGPVTSAPLQTSGVSTIASSPVVALSHPQVTVVPVVSQVQPPHHPTPVVHVAPQPQLDQKMQHVPVQQIPVQQPQVAVQQQPQVAVQQQPHVPVHQQQPQVAVHQHQQPVLQQHQMQHPGPQIHVQQVPSSQTQPVMSGQHVAPQQPLLPNPHGLPPTSAPLIQPAPVMTVPVTMMAQPPLGQMQTVVMQPTSTAPAFVPHAPQISVSQPNVVPVPMTGVYQNPTLVGAAALPPAQWGNAAQAAPVGPAVTVGAVEPPVNASNNPTKESSQPEGGTPSKVDPSETSKNVDDASVTVQSVVEDSESASGTSAVAIDNKIEQAMDLVKSHLMFAVREEVEVLKERIAELMDRIGQLEMENTILKAHATQEALAQLGQQQPQQQQSQLPTGNGSSAS